MNISEEARAQGAIGSDAISQSGQTGHMGKIEMGDAVDTQRVHFGDHVLDCGETTWQLGDSTGNSSTDPTDRSWIFVAKRGKRSKSRPSSQS